MLGKSVLAIFVILLCLATAGWPSAREPNLVPNGDFGAGLAHWSPAPAPKGKVVLVQHKELKALRLESPETARRESDATSDTFPVEGGVKYHLEALVRRAGGVEVRFKVTLEWLDAKGKHLRYDNDWKGTSAGPDFIPHGGDFTSPAEARFARILLGVSPGTCVEFARVSLRRLGARLEITALACDKVIIKQGKPVEVSATVSNTGGRPTGPVTLRFGKERHSLPSLAPDATQQVTWRWLPERAGYQLLTVRAFAAGSTRRKQSLVCIVEPGARPAAVLADGGRRLAWLKAQDKVGPLLLQVKRADQWFTVAVVPWPAALFFPEKSGLPPLVLSASRCVLHGKTARLEAACEDAAGRTWRAQIEYRLQKAPFVEVKVRLESDAAAEITGCSALKLYAGEGTFGQAKDWALFASAEMLRPGERSSANGIRWQPQPGMITFPCMAVLHQGLAAGVMWDPVQNYAKNQLYPAAKFASPNRLEGYANHLLELQLPGVPEGLALDETPGYTFEVKPGAPLSLSATLVLSSNLDLPGLVQAYFKRYGKPKLQPAPRSLDEEFDLCMQAFCTSLWHPRERAWVRELDRADLPPDWRAPEVLYALKLYLELRPDSPLAPVVKDRLEAASAAARKQSYHATFYGPLTWLAGANCDWVAARLQEVKASLASQRPDGSWPYHVTYWQGKPLGKEGDTSVGTTALKAWPILRWAEITGDEQLITSGLKAVDFLATLARPEGAEVWEIPLHDPNLRAAGYAIRCTLAAWRLTHKQTYLDQARYWAWVSLPFCYWWNYPDWPLMRYSTVSVLQHPWWPGRPVQWVGLQYAQALYDLAEVDDSFCWRTVAEGITRAGTWWQATSGRRLGTYPDFYDTATRAPGGPGLNPTLILANLFTELGVSPEPKTRIIETSQGKVRLTAAAALDQPRFSNGKLTFGVRSRLDSPCLVGVAGLPKPSRIICDTHLVPEVEAFEDAAPLQWRWLAAERLVLLKVQPKAHEAEIQLEY